MKIFRDGWNWNEPRLLSYGFFSLAYVLSFIRLLSFTRTSPIFGPLCASLTEVSMNVIQFLVIFSLLLFAFALGLSELYLNCDTLQGVLKGNATKIIKNKTCNNITMFAGLGDSLAELFWSLFGYLDSSYFTASAEPKTLNGYLAIFLLVIFHISVIVVLLNMLIAMVSHSFDKTYQNKDVEWKFQRTRMWMRFIKKDFLQPPPMNLFPNFYKTFIKIKSLAMNIKGLFKSISCSRTDSDVTSIYEEKVKTKQCEMGLMLLKRLRKTCFFNHILTEKCFIETCKSLYDMEATLRTKYKRNKKRSEICNEDEKKLLNNLLF